MIIQSVNFGLFNAFSLKKDVIHDHLNITVLNIIISLRWKLILTF
jgi:hypothetical protein